MSDDPMMQLAEVWKKLVVTSIDATFALCSAMKGKLGAGGRDGPSRAYTGQCEVAYLDPGRVRVFLPSRPPSVANVDVSLVVPGEIQIRHTLMVNPQPHVTPVGGGWFDLDLGNIPHGGWLCELRDAAGVMLGAAVVYIDDLHPTS